MRILGIDPGDKTGAVLLDSEGPSVLRVETIEAKNFNSWLDTWNQTDSPWLVDIVAIEDFIARPSFTDGRWTELPVAKLIGRVEFRCHQLKIRCVVQQPSIKPVGYRFAGLAYPPKKNPMIHVLDATAHAYFLLRNGYKKVS